jgi:hypothetical protein
MMNKNVAIVVLGVLVVVLGGFLLGTGCGTAAPPIDPPPPTPTPTPQPQLPCEYLTVEFYKGTFGEPAKTAVFAKPEHLDDVKECAMVIFSNKTDTAIKLEFQQFAQPTKSPFAGVDVIELEPYGGKTQFSKAYPVAVELPDDTTYFEYKYKVVDVGPPETEQSPRIRIGPRQPTASEGD